MGKITGFLELERTDRKYKPAEERVSALAFLPIAFMMPVTYALMTPLALFTLDSGSWETRGHGETEATAEPCCGTTSIRGRVLVIRAAKSRSVWRFKVSRTRKLVPSPTRLGSSTAM